MKKATIEIRNKDVTSEALEVEFKKLDERI